MKALFLAFSILLFYANSHAAILTFDMGNAANGLTCSTGSCFGEPAFSDYVNISSYDGLIVDGITTQSASGSHSGSPNGSESPGIDNPWEWFGSTGMFFTSSPVTKVGGSGNSVMLDMSGLSITWNGSIIPRVENQFSLPNNPAIVTCLFTCADNETYLLTYKMALPGECYYDPSCFGAVYRYYSLSLRGVIVGNDISNVPVPGAIWLMISGLVFLVRFKRHEKG